MKRDNAGNAEVSNVKARISKHKLSMCSDAFAEVGCVLLPGAVCRQ